jgi:1-acyl-sn-glycerol-3-phosphate acyltransferase
MAVITVVCGSLSLLARWSTRRAMCSTALLASGRGVRVGSGVKAQGNWGGEPAQTPGAVYTSNHTSYMDTPVIFGALPFQFRILASKELWPIPFIGWYLNRSGQIQIDTGNPRATLSSLGAGAKALRSGMSLFVFPEGGGPRTAN